MSINGGRNQLLPRPAPLISDIIIKCGPNYKASIYGTTLKKNFFPATYLALAKFFNVSLI